MSNMAEGAEPRTADGTGGGLIAFLNWTMAKNELVEATASALRTGCQKVLSVEDDPESLDLRDVDIDNLIARFRNKHRLDMRDRTLDQYEQRFRQSVEMYLRWLDNDPAWKPAQRKKPVAVNGGGKSPAAPSANATSPRSNREPEVSVSPALDSLIEYPFPIRPGLRGRITLPEDLTLKEAHRIANFVASLAFEEQAEMPPNAPPDAGASE
jgi:hypothetical protein